MRGETIFSAVNPLFAKISIHSPHARGDNSSDLQLTDSSDFNPLPSCEGRPAGTIPSLPISKFQSTPLMRGETTTGYVDVAKIPISIHSPHARGDVKSFALTATVRVFQSTPLMRGETRETKAATACCRFQSTPLMRGETSSSTNCLCIARFQSTPLMRGETYSDAERNTYCVISIHSPHARGDQRAFVQC